MGDKVTIEEILKKENLTEEELKKIIQQSKKPKLETKNIHEHYHNTKHHKFIVTGDWHVGHQNFRYDVLDGMKKIIKKEKIEEIYHTGDLIEGMSNREGHIYELRTLGVTNHIDEVVDIINDLNKTFYFINGNHDLWAKMKSNQGFNTGKNIEEQCPKAIYLGDMKAEVKLSPYAKMWLTHEGNSAYALSYSGQKRINSIAGGNKPGAWFNGHLHKALYMEYRNIHFFESGTLESQTDFMKMKGSSAHVGFWLVDIYHNKKGINQIKSSWFPYY
jgi:DNA polymerase II small subunit/DNA polymerase delta subunit B